MARGKTTVVVKDLGLKNLRKKIRVLSKAGASVTSGVHEGSPRAGDGLSNAEVASFHEFGTSTVPARPFVGPTVKENEAEYLRMLAQALKKDDWTSASTRDVKDSLELVGMKMAADMRRRIRDGIEPPLAESTIKRKGSSKPLVDTAQMVNSIKHKVHGL